MGPLSHNEERAYNPESNANVLKMLQTVSKSLMLKKNCIDVYVYRTPKPRKWSSETNSWTRNYRNMGQNCVRENRAKQTLE